MQYLRENKNIFLMTKAYEYIKAPWKGKKREKIERKFRGTLASNYFVKTQFLLKITMSLNFKERIFVAAKASWHFGWFSLNLSTRNWEIIIKSIIEELGAGVRPTVNPGAPVQTSGSHDQYWAKISNIVCTVECVHTEQLQF